MGSAHVRRRAGRRCGDGAGDAGCRCRQRDRRRLPRDDDVVDAEIVDDEGDQVTDAPTSSTSRSFRDKRRVHVDPRPGWRAGAAGGGAGRPPARPNPAATVPLGRALAAAHRAGRAHRGPAAGAGRVRQLPQAGRARPRGGPRPGRRPRCWPSCCRCSTTSAGPASTASSSGAFKPVAEALEATVTKLGLERFGEVGRPVRPDHARGADAHVLRRRDRADLRADHAARLLLPRARRAPGAGRRRRTDRGASQVEADAQADRYLEGAEPTDDPTDLG